MPHRNLVIIILAAVVSLICYQKAPQNRYVRTVTNAMKVIGDHYVKEVDQRELFENAMDGMVSGLDQYSNFISPDRFQQVQESLDQEFGGIGIVVEGPPRTERLTVVSPLVGTPAFEAGMRSGDVIMKIDETSTEKMKLEDAVKLMRGRRGSPVTLVVRHPGSEQSDTIQMKRDIIPIESVLGDTRKEDGSWNFVLEEDSNIGYIRLTTFGEHTVDELREALQFKDSPVRAFILDVRGNPGGLLQAAVQTCDMFIQRGVIVSTRGRGGVERQRHEATSDTLVPRDIPMVVLTDKGSASASEIVAACLKDHARAIVVGERTWGKGSVQNIIKLEGGKSALKLTTASYWRPSGKNIHRHKDDKEDDEWGVQPTEGYAVEVPDEELEKIVRWRRHRDIVRTPGDEPMQEGVEQVDDPQLRKAIEFLQEKLQADPGVRRA